MQNNKSVTAVEWLEEMMNVNGNISVYFKEILDQAKEMEKEQIMKARQDIFHTGNLTNEQYYNETFKTE